MTSDRQPASRCNGLGTGGARQPARLALAAALLMACAWGGGAAATEVEASAAAAHPAPRRSTGSGLEARVRLLTGKLGLDVRQQEALRQVLLEQREEVLAVWADESRPAAARVQATEAVGERTADRIRALLNESQRARYNRPRSKEAAPASPRPSVETWMKTAAG